MRSVSVGFDITLSGILLKHYTKYYISEDVKILYILSDNCAGQNKSMLNVKFLTILAASGRFLSSHHHCPEHGHSFLP
jgi:hypothetical protein